MKKFLAVAMAVVLCPLLYSCYTPQPGDEDIRHGNEKFKSNDYTNAIEDYKKAIESNPNNPHNTYAYDNMATAKEKLGDYVGAIKDWEKVIEIDPSTKSKIQPCIDRAKAKLK